MYQFARAAIIKYSKLGDFNTRDKGYFAIKKGSIQEDIILVKSYAPNIGAPEHIKQILLMDRKTVTVS